MNRQTVEEKQRDIAQAIIDHYIEKKTGADAKVIATRLKWNVAKVRSAVAVPGLYQMGVTSENHSRPSYSSSYRGMQFGAHLVAVWYPTLYTLRRMILDERAARTDPT